MDHFLKSCTLGKARLIAGEKCLIDHFDLVSFHGLDATIAPPELADNQDRSPDCNILSLGDEGVNVPQERSF